MIQNECKTPIGYLTYILYKKFLDARRWSDSALWNHCLPSVCPSDRPSLSFLKIGSLVFCDVVHDDSWPWYLVTDKARFLEKKIFGSPNLGQMAQHRTQNEVFCYFLKFVSLVFLEIAYNDRLQQCLTSSRGRIHEKFWAPKLGHNLA